MGVLAASNLDLSLDGHDVLLARRVAARAPDNCAKRVVAAQGTAAAVFVGFEPQDGLVVLVRVWVQGSGLFLQSRLIPLASDLVPLHVNSP